MEIYDVNPATVRIPLWQRLARQAVSFATGGLIYFFGVFVSDRLWLHDHRGSLGMLVQALIWAFLMTITFSYLMPIPFCFIAITNAAYVGLPREASNQVSGIINFVRNVGGSILIALTGALVTNRTMFHEARLQNAMQVGSYGYQNQLSTMTGAFMQSTGSQSAAHSMAQA